jgi:Polyketide cyclase / dehydrase and lipid transport
MTSKRLHNRLIFLIAAIAFVIIGCAPMPPTAPPDYSAAPPEIDKTGFYIENQETITIDMPRSQLLAWVEQNNLSDILTATEGMPAVENTVVLSGGEWGDVGDRRRIELADGHYAAETILERTDQRMRYQVWGFTNQAGRFADYAIGEFVYDDQGDTTLVTWTYRFHPHSWIARLPLSSFVNNTFKGFMQNGLARIKEGAETDQP